MKHRFKGAARSGAGDLSVTESFRHWLESEPGEVGEIRAALAEQQAKRDVREHVREERARAKRERQGRGGARGRRSEQPDNVPF